MDKPHRKVPGKMIIQKTLGAVTVTCFMLVACTGIDQSEVDENATTEQAAMPSPPRSVELYSFGTAYIDNGLQITAAGQDTQVLAIEQSYHPSAWQPHAAAMYALSGYVECDKSDGSERVVDITIGWVMLSGGSARIDTVSCAADEVAIRVQLNVEYYHIFGSKPATLGTVANASIESSGPIGVQPRVTTLDLGAGHAILKAYRDHVETVFEEMQSDFEIRAYPYIYCGEQYWWNEYAITTAVGQTWQAQLDCTDFGVAPVRYGLQIEQPAVD